MMKNSLYKPILATLILALMFCMPLISANTFGYNYLDNRDYVVEGANYSINVNNTNFFDGYSVAELYTYYKGLYDLVYAPLSALNNYLLLDQTTPQTITGGIPLLEETRVIDKSHQLVDKLYVDIAVSSLGQRFYMLNESSGIEDYYIACPLGCPQDAFDLTFASLTDGQYVTGWISPENMSMPTLIAGIYDWHLFAEKPTGTKTLRVYWTLNERLENGTEILIETSAQSNLIDDKLDNSIPLLLSEDYTLFNSSSRVVGKVYAVVGTSGNNPTLKIYGGGEDNSHWEIPINTEILDTLYIDYTEIANYYNTTQIDDRYSNNTGDQDLSGYVPYTGATTDVDLGANDLTVDTDTFFVDASTGNVGIGTTSPSSKLTLSYVNPNDADVLFNIYSEENAGDLFRIEKHTDAGNYVELVAPGNWLGFDVGTGGNVNFATNPNFQLQGNGKLSSYTGTLTVQTRNGDYDLIFGTDETERMRIDATDGNVGIGTDSPTEKLEIDGNLFLNGDNDKVLLGTGKDASIYYDGTNMVINPKEVGSGYLSVLGDAEITGDLTVDTDTLFVDSVNNRVGIGTDSPRGKLDVVSGALYTDTAIFERTTSATTQLYNAFRLLSTSSGDMSDGFGTGFAFNIKDDAGVINYVSDIGGIRDGADNSGATVFRTAALGTATERMRITSAGNVGIGTTSPSEKLEVDGNGLFSGDVFIPSGSLTVGTTADDGRVLRAYRSSSATYLPAVIENAGTGDTGISFKLPTAAYSFGIDRSDSSAFKISGSSLDLGSNTKMRIYADIDMYLDTNIHGDLSVDGDATIGESLAIGSNTHDGLSAGDINASTIYYNVLTAKSPIIMCSEDWCSVDLPKNKESYYIHKDDDWNILEISDKSGKLIGSSEFIYKNGFIVGSVKIVTLQEVIDKTIKLRDEIKEEKAKQSIIDNCLSLGYTWKDGCYNIYDEAVTYNEAVIKEPVYNTTKSEYNCLKINPETLIEEETICYEETKTSSIIKYQYSFKEGCNWNNELKYYCNTEVKI